MAKKRFTFADAKQKIKELEEAFLDEQQKVKDLLEDASLKQDNNVYDAGEQKFIKIYQWGFYILLVVNAILLYIR